MKRQAREVYGFVERIPTRRFPTAWAVLLIAIAGMIGGALWA